MPLTLTLTEGVLPRSAEAQAISRITMAFLEHHGLGANQAMRSQITATVHVLPKSSTYAGGEEAAGAWVEWKVPSFALADRKAQLGFCAEATEIVHELAGGKLPKDRIYTNVVHAVDGTWNWGGKALTNAEIGAEIARG